MREHLKEILFVGGAMTAYDAYKHYIKLFAKTSQRNVYYQLERGVELNLFELEIIKDEKGDYSWGDTATKKYFRLAKDVNPNFSKEVRNYFNELNLKKETDKKLIKDKQR